MTGAVLGSNGGRLRRRARGRRLEDLRWHVCVLQQVLLKLLERGPDEDVWRGRRARAAAENDIREGLVLPILGWIRIALAVLASAARGNLLGVLLRCNCAAMVQDSAATHRCKPGAEHVVSKAKQRQRERCTKQHLVEGELRTCGAGGCGRSAAGSGTTAPRRSRPWHPLGTHRRAGTARARARLWPSLPVLRCARSACAPRAACPADLLLHRSPTVFVAGKRLSQVCCCRDRCWWLAGAHRRARKRPPALRGPC
jgi:hypothetical protein